MSDPLVKLRAGWAGWHWVATKRRNVVAQMDAFVDRDELVCCDEDGNDLLGEVQGRIARSHQPACSAHVKV